MKALLTIGGVVGIILTLAGLVVWWAYAVSVLWLWFVTPFGIQAISLAHAYGLTLVVSGLMSTRGLGLGVKKEENSWIAEISVAVIAPAVLLLFGYIAVGFM